MLCARPYADALDACKNAFPASCSFSFKLLSFAEPSSLSNTACTADKKARQGSSRQFLNYQCTRTILCEPILYNADAVHNIKHHLTTTYTPAHGSSNKVTRFPRTQSEQRVPGSQVRLC